MSGYLAYQTADGRALSLASKQPESVPDGVTVATLTDAEFGAMQTGSSRWDPATKAVVVDAEKAQATQEATATRDRMEQVVAKARAIMADPAGSPDWTAAERKVLLAALVLRSR